MPQLAVRRPQTTAIKRARRTARGVLMLRDMKLNLILAIGLILTIGLAVVRDQQKAAEFEERARAAEVTEDLSLGQASK